MDQEHPSNPEISNQEQAKQLLRSSLPLEMPNYAPARPDLSDIEQYYQRRLFPQMIPDDIDDIITALGNCQIDILTFASLVKKFYDQAGKPKISADSRIPKNGYEQWDKLIGDGIKITSTYLNRQMVESGQPLASIRHVDYSQHDQKEIYLELPFIRRFSLENNIITEVGGFLGEVGDRYSSALQAQAREVINHYRAIDLNTSPEIVRQQELEYLTDKLAVEKEYLSIELQRLNEQINGR